MVNNGGNKKRMATAAKVVVDVVDLEFGKHASHSAKRKGARRCRISGMASASGSFSCARS